MLKMNGTAAVVAASALFSASVFAVAAAAQKDVLRNLRPVKLDPRVAEALQKPRSLTTEEQIAIAARLAEARKKSYQPGLRDQIPPADWIDIAYHGGLYDANFEPVEIDRIQAFKIQESMFSIFSEAADPNALRKVYDGKISEFFYLKQNDDDVALVLRSTVLEAMLGALPDKMRARYAWRHQLLQREIRKLLDGAFWQIHPDVLRRIKEGMFRVPPGGWLTPVETTTAYMDTCAANDVPIPPDFPSADWKLQGEQLVEFILADGFNTEVYAYRGATGVCMALPRTTGGRTYSAGGAIAFDGIICQSETTGKACFWDNIDRETGAQIRGNPVRLEINKLMDGSNLVENCTSCHRGANVFNIHPGTAVDLRRPSDGPSDGRPYDIHPGSPAAPIRYAPIGSNRYGPWTNPGPLSLAGTGYGCQSCHEIPDTTPVTSGDGVVSGGYCGILRQAAQSTMPPGGPAAGWPAPASAANLFDEHTAFLRARCGS